MNSENKSKYLKDGSNSSSSRQERNIKETEGDMIDGFGYCTSQQSKCLSDCIGSTPALSNLN